MKWIVPEGDQVTVRDIENEWKNKGEFVLSLCKHKNTVVQAGGNLGIFPYYLAEYFLRVVTYEPVQKNLKCLYKNIKDINNIEVHEQGLGNKYSKAVIELEKPGNCGAIRLQYTDKDTGIHISRLDRWEYERIDLLWLDVEGFEVKALQGAEQNIRKCKPVIVVENNGLIHEFPSDKEGSQDFRNWMWYAFGYKFYKRIMRDDVFIPT